MRSIHPAATAFDAHADEYDALRRRLVPPFELLYGAAVDALELLGEAPGRVLDLGAGTGVLSGFVRARHPSCELVLLDSAARMLEQASAAEWAGATARMSHDRRASVADQLAWLTEAGFVQADCLFKRYGFAVLFARRSSPGETANAAPPKMETR